MLDKDNKQSFLNKQFENLRITSIFLFPLVTFLAFRAQDIIPFLFGKEYGFMVLPFQVVVWGVIFIYCNYLFLKIALFINKTDVVLSSFLILILYAVVLNFFLIPRYGMEGISIATVASLAAMFIFIVFYLAEAGVKIPLYKSCEKPAIASMGLTIILHYADSLPFVLILLFGFIGYSMIFIITSWLEKEGI